MREREKMGGQERERERGREGGREEEDFVQHRICAGAIPNEVGPTREEVGGWVGGWL